MNFLVGNGSKNLRRGENSRKHSELDVFQEERFLEKVSQMRKKHIAYIVI